MRKAGCYGFGQRCVSLHLVTMVLAGAMLAGCQTGPVVVGKVICADGRPADGAVVTVIARDRIRMGGFSEPRKIGQVSADEGGAFSARVSGAPQYVVLAARKPGWAIGWEGWNPERPSRRVRIRLKPAATLTGRVVDEAGKPVPAAKVWVAGRGISGEGIEGFEAVTDKDGRFAFHDIPQGAKVKFEVLAAGYAKIDARRQEGDVVAPCEDVELKLSPQAELEAEVVEKLTGRPVSDVELVAHVWQKTYSRLAKPVPGQPGHYRWQNMPAGRGMVGMTTRLDRPAVWACTSARMRTKVGQTTRVRLEVARGLPVEFIVKDAATGQPIAKASVGAYNRQTRTECAGLSGRDGVIRSVALPGIYQISWAWADKYVGERQEGKLVVPDPTSRPASAPAKPPRAEILLTRAPRIHGVVRFPDGRIAPDVEVILVNDWGGTVSGADGRFEFWREYSHQPGAQPMLLLARDEERDLIATARVEDLAKPVEINLRPGDVRRVRVVDAAGKAVPRARVIASVGWYNPDPPMAQWESVTDAAGLARLPVLPPDTPVSIRAACAGFACAQQLLPAGRTNVAVARVSEFRLTPVGPALSPAKAERVDIPPIPGGWAVWGATGTDDRGHVWFGVTAHEVDVPSAHLFEYEPETGKLTDRGDVVGKLKEAGLLRSGEQQMKIHTRICQVGDWLYFASMDEKGEDERKGVLPTWGGHLWRISLKDYQWEHLRSVPQALIALGAGGGYVYALGYWDHVLWQYSTRDGKVRSVKVGAPAGHISRNLIVDRRGHAFVPRVTVTPGGMQAALVEFDTELKELRSTPLPYYGESSPIDSHGIVGLSRLPDGRIAFVTHNGFLSVIQPPEHAGAAEVTHLGFLHPDGPKHVPSMFLDDSGRVLMAAVGKGYDRPYEWLAYDLVTGIQRIGPLEVVKPAGLRLGRASLYGSVCRDSAGACYVGGVINIDTEEAEYKSVPILLKIMPPEVAP